MVMRVSEFVDVVRSRLSNPKLVETPAPGTSTIRLWVFSRESVPLSGCGVTPVLPDCAFECVAPTGDDAGLVNFIQEIDDFVRKLG